MARWTAAKQAAKYARLRAARKCPKCQAGLQDTDVRLCVECAEKAREHQADYQVTPAGRASQAKYAAKRRRQRAAAGLCRDCAAPAKPVVPGTTRCQAHHDESKERRIAREERAEGEARAAA
jgi:hypothetical protein